MSTRPPNSQRARLPVARRARTSLLGLGLGLSAIDLYLVVLLAAAAWPKRPSWAHGTGSDGEQLRFLVLVPAHDEEDVIGATLAALDRVAYPADRRRVVVIADNCADRTAEVAAKAGATVLERTDPDRRGKGNALNWALDELSRLDPDADAIAILDADCLPTPDWLTVLAARLAAGASAVQASYVVANPGASTQTALRSAAFALINTVRPMGKDRLGLSCGLLGTGMAFRRGLLERHRFNPDSLVEDSDLHLRLVAAGERVTFAPEVAVRSAMPTSRQAIGTQQRRWEGGRAQLIRDWTLPLLARGLRRFDPVRIHAGLEPLVPPQSLLALAHVGLAALSALVRSVTARRLAALNIAMQTLFILGGLRLTQAPRGVYAGLLAAPLLVARKLRLLGGLLVRGAPRSWERTARDDRA